MAGDYKNVAACGHVQDSGHGSAGKMGVAGTDHFIKQDDAGILSRQQGEGQANLHAGRIGSDG